MSGSDHGRTERIHKTGLSQSNVRVSAGYYAINPAGHLVLLPPATTLKVGWKLATPADLEAAKAAAVSIAASDASAEERARQATAAADKREAIEAAGETLTVSDADLAAAHERGDIKHPWPVKASKRRGHKDDGGADPT